MMEKFRMFFSFIAVAPVCCRQGGAARQMARPSVLPQGKFLFPAEQGIRLFFGAVEYLRHALHEAGVEGRERFILHRGERAVLFGKLRERGGVGDVVRTHLRIHRAGLVGRGI